VTTTDAIRAVLADGDWHTLDELVTAAAHTIEPGRAYREGERKRRKPRSGVTRPERRVNGNDATAVDAGRRSLIASAARTLVKRGHAERLDGRYRLVST